MIVFADQFINLVAFHRDSHPLCFLDRSDPDELACFAARRPSAQLGPSLQFTTIESWTVSESWEEECIVFQGENRDETREQQVAALF